MCEPSLPAVHVRSVCGFSIATLPPVNSRGSPIITLRTPPDLPPQHALAHHGRPNPGCPGSASTPATTRQPVPQLLLLPQLHVRLVHLGKLMLAPPGFSLACSYKLL